MAPSIDTSLTEETVQLFLKRGVSPDVVQRCRDINKTIITCDALQEAHDLFAAAELECLAGESPSPDP